MHLDVLILPKLSVPEELLTLSATFGESGGVSRAAEVGCPRSRCSLCVSAPLAPRLQLQHSHGLSGAGRASAAFPAAAALAAILSCRSFLF